MTPPFHSRRCGCFDSTTTTGLFLCHHHFIVHIRTLAIIDQRCTFSTLERQELTRRLPLLVGSRRAHQQRRPDQSDAPVHDAQHAEHARHATDHRTRHRIVQSRASVHRVVLGIYVGRRHESRQERPRARPRGDDPGHDALVLREVTEAADDGSRVGQSDAHADAGLEEYQAAERFAVRRCVGASRNEECSEVGSGTGSDPAFESTSEVHEEGLAEEDRRVYVEGVVIRDGRIELDEVARDVGGDVAPHCFDADDEMEDGASHQG
mmetsp:Transcript_34749/g.75079  ORF Transcript_34749/g.75079 Transcript_34749/m.75079 type:complete len:265 (+) Transcript_34749:816-1610(+)